MTFGKNLVLQPRSARDERILRVFGAPAPKATMPPCEKLRLPAEQRYIPSPPIHFCVELALPEPTSRSELFEIFTQDWFRAASLPNLCGHDVERGEVFFVGTPASEKFLASRGVVKNAVYDRAYFAVPVLDDDDEPRSREHFEALVNAALRVAARWSPRALVPPREASEKARELAELRARYSGELGFLVRAPDAGFLGRSIWNVLHTIGLAWGDMDLFNWTTDSAWNDPVLFWVGTSTEPNYFLPEEIVADKRYSDLRFAMSIGAKPEPDAIARAMLAFGAEVARRLKGTLDVDRETFLADVRQIHAELEAHGYAPGAPATVELF